MFAWVRFQWSVQGRNGFFFGDCAAKSLQKGDVLRSLSRYCWMETTLQLYVIHYVLFSTSFSVLWERHVLMWHRECLWSLPSCKVSNDWICVDIEQANCSAYWRKDFGGAHFEVTFEYLFAACSRRWTRVADSGTKFYAVSDHCALALKAWENFLAE